MSGPVSALIQYAQGLGWSPTSFDQWWVEDADFHLDPRIKEEILLIFRPMILSSSTDPAEILRHTIPEAVRQRRYRMIVIHPWNLSWMEFSVLHLMMTMIIRLLLWKYIRNCLRQEDLLISSG